MECILCCWDITEDTSSKINYSEFPLQECLNVCKNYLTVEFSEFDVQTDDRMKMYCNPICSTCLPFVTKLLELFKEFTKFSRVFSENLMNRRTIKKEFIDADECSEIDDIKSENASGDDPEGDTDSYVGNADSVEDDKKPDIVASDEMVKTPRDVENEASNTKAQNTANVYHQTELNVRLQKLPDTVSKCNTTSVSSTSKGNCSLARFTPRIFRKVRTKNLRPYIGEDNTEYQPSSKQYKAHTKLLDSCGRKKNKRLKQRDIKQTIKLIAKKSKRKKVSNPSDKKPCELYEKSADTLSIPTLEIVGKPYKCTEINCQAEFSNPSNLKVHTARIHSDEYHYVCKHESCAKKFKTANQLYYHCQVYHKPPDQHHICEYCGKSFKMKKQIVIHLRHHNTNDRFFCSECSKSYRSNAELKIHVQLVHTKEISYNCEQCGKSLASKERLKNHYRIHSGEKYKCEVCGKLYASTTARNTHRKNANH